jgi:hypothetical protein
MRKCQRNFPCTWKEQGQEQEILRYSSTISRISRQLRKLLKNNSGLTAEFPNAVVMGMEQLDAGARAIVRRSNNDAGQPGARRGRDRIAVPRNKNEVSAVRPGGDDSKFDFFTGVANIRHYSILHSVWRVAIFFVPSAAVQRMTSSNRARGIICAVRLRPTL